MKEHEIGDSVHIRHAPDIEATVTAILRRTGGYMQYELTWMANGEIKTAWLEPLLVLSEKKAGGIGFNDTKK